MEKNTTMSNTQNPKALLFLLIFILLLVPARSAFSEARPHDIGQMMYYFKSYLESVTRGAYDDYTATEKNNAKNLWIKIDRQVSACIKKSSGNVSCLWGVGNTAYNSVWSQHWEKDVGYYKRAWLLEPRAAQPWIGNPQVPGLSCATYSRGLGSSGSFINVSTTGNCDPAWAGTYYWNSSLRKYCKNNNCNSGYIDTVPPPN